MRLNILGSNWSIENLNCSELSFGAHRSSRKQDIMTGFKGLYEEITLVAILRAMGGSHSLTVLSTFHGLLSVLQNWTERTKIISLGARLLLLHLIALLRGWWILTFRLHFNGLLIHRANRPPLYKIQVGYIWSKHPFLRLIIWSPSGESCTIIWFSTVSQPSKCRSSGLYLLGLQKIQK